MKSLFTLAALAVFSMFPIAASAITPVNSEPLVLAGTCGDNADSIDEATVWGQSVAGAKVITIKGADAQAFLAAIGKDYNLGVDPAGVGSILFVLKNDVGVIGLFGPDGCDQLATQIPSAIAYKYLAAAGISTD